MMHHQICYSRSTTSIFTSRSWGRAAWRRKTAWWRLWPSPGSLSTSDASGGERGRAWPARWRGVAQSGAGW